MQTNNKNYQVWFQFAERVQREIFVKKNYGIVKKILPIMGTKHLIKTLPFDTLKRITKNHYDKLMSNIKIQMHSQFFLMILEKNLDE